MSQRRRAGLEKSKRRQQRRKLHLNLRLQSVLTDALRRPPSQSWTTIFLHVRRRPRRLHRHLLASRHLHRLIPQAPRTQLGRRPARVPRNYPQGLALTWLPLKLSSETRSIILLSSSFQDRAVVLLHVQATHVPNLSLLLSGPLRQRRPLAPHLEGLNHPSQVLARGAT